MYIQLLQSTNRSLIAARNSTTKAEPFLSPPSRAKVVLAGRIPHKELRNCMLGPVGKIGCTNPGSDGAIVFL